MTTWIRLTLTLCVALVGLALRPGIAAEDEHRLPATDNYRLTYANVLRIEVESAQPRPNSRLHRPRLFAADGDRFRLGFPTTQSGTPAFAACRELDAVRARRVTWSADWDAIHCSLWPTLDSTCVPTIEPPGVCLPAIAGIRAYFDFDWGRRPDDDDDDDGGEGWSAGLAIEF